MVVVKAVNDIKIQVVGAQPLQGTINFPVDSFLREAAMVEINLTSQDYLVARYLVLFQRVTDVFLTGSHPVYVSGIEKVNAETKGMLYHPVSLLFIKDPAVGLHGRLTETHPTNC